MKRKVLAVSVLFLLSLTAVFLAVSRSTPVNAQTGGEIWASSAEPPADFPPVNFSPADDPAVNNQVEEVLGGSLESWRVAGSALKPRESDVAYTASGGGACTYVTGGDAATVWNTPVNLHNGSVVDTLRMYYYDTSGSNTSAWFTAYDLFGSIVQEWGVASSGSSGNSFNDSDSINHTIDNSVYSYVLNWRPNSPGSTLQLCGFRVFYTPPPYGLGFIPAVLNP